MVGRWCGISLFCSDIHRLPLFSMSLHFIWKGNFWRKLVIGVAYHQNDDKWLTHLISQQLFTKSIIYSRFRFSFSKSKSIVVNSVFSSPSHLSFHSIVRFEIPGRPISGSFIRFQQEDDDEKKQMNVLFLFRQMFGQDGEEKD